VTVVAMGVKMIVTCTQHGLIPVMTFVITKLPSNVSNEIIYREGENLEALEIRKLTDAKRPKTE